MQRDLPLLHAWKQGDRAAGSALVKRHFAAVCRFFRSKLGDDVQDLVQQTFLDCVRNYEKIDESLGFRTFVFAIAHRRLIDELRRRGRQPGFDPARESLAELGVSPSGVIAADQEAHVLQQALQRIPLEQQVTVELFYWEQMPGKQIAAILGVSEHTVRSRLARAKATLKAELSKRADLPASAMATDDDLVSCARRVGILTLPPDAER
jgi:RNA polymerase sigma-70 factor (ECF subfamily)